MHVPFSKHSRLHGPQWSPQAPSGGATSTRLVANHGQLDALSCRSVASAILSAYEPRGVHSGQQRTCGLRAACVAAATASETVEANPPQRPGFAGQRPSLLLDAQREARELLSSVRRGGIGKFTTSHNRCNKVLKDLCELGERWSEVHHVYKELRGAGAYLYESTYTTLMTRALESGAALDVVDVLADREAAHGPPALSAYCSLVSRLLKLRDRGSPAKQAAHAVWRALRATGMRLDAPAYRTGMNLCVELGLLKEASQLLDAMRAAGHRPGYGAYNILIKYHTERGDMDAARRLFTELRAYRGQAPLVISAYNTLLTGFVRLGDLIMARAVLDKARREGAQPDAFTYSSYAAGLAAAGRLDEAEALLDEAAEAGVPPSEALYGAVLDGCVRRNDWERANRILVRMRVDGLAPNRAHYNMLIRGNTYATGYAAVTTAYGPAAPAAAPAAPAAAAPVAASSAARAAVTGAGGVGSIEDFLGGTSGWAPPAERGIGHGSGSSNGDGGGSGGLNTAAGGGGGAGLNGTAGGGAVSSGIATAGGGDGGAEPNSAVGGGGGGRLNRPVGSAGGAGLNGGVSGGGALNNIAVAGGAAGGGGGGPSGGAFAVESLLAEMRASGVQPDIVTYGTLMHAAVRGGSVSGALSVVSAMRLEGVPPDGAVFTSLMKLFKQQGQHAQALEFFTQLASSRTSSVDGWALCCLVALHASAGRMGEAREVARRADAMEREQGRPPRPEVTYALLQGFAQRRELQPALLTFRRFLASGGRPHRKMCELVYRLCLAHHDFGAAGQVLRAMRLMRGLEMREELYRRLWHEAQRRAESGRRPPMSSAGGSGSGGGSGSEGAREASAWGGANVSGGAPGGGPPAGGGGYNPDTEKLKWWFGLPNRYYESDWR